MKRILWMLALVSASCGPAHEGAAAFEAGRFDEALRRFAEAERAAPAPELAFDVALAALRGGDLDTAAGAAARAIETSMNADVGTDVRADARFVLGAAAWERCIREMAQAARPDSEPFAYDLAARHATRAAGEWAEAVALRGSWPAAARNAERALAKAEECRARKAEAEASKRRKEKSPPKPGGDSGSKGDAGGASDDGAGGREPTRGAALPDLAASELDALMDRLASRERTKLDDRRARQRSARAGGERDW